MIAALSTWHEQHRAAVKALDAVTAVPTHVLIESYSVLTRLPGGLAVPAETAATVLGRRFAAAPPLRLSERARRSALKTLAAAAVFGGATYDGLVALEASAHGHTLVTLDERAVSTYQRLGIAFELIGA